MGKYATSGAKIPSDLEIAQAAKLVPITKIASDLGITSDELEPYGKYMAKIGLSILERMKNKPDGKFITVTAITPTPLGEGKTVTAFGLGQGLAKIGKRVCNTTRQPSKGPTFGIKGGACGGGYSQMLPMEQINLNFTGDIHAVECAHNLCNAAMDASIFHGNPLRIDPSNINLRRCIDLNDRALRQVIVTPGGKLDGNPRISGYDITAATETAAILALANDLFDLRARLGKMICGFSYDGHPVTADDIRVAGAMTVLLQDAIKPNLVQSTENHPIICHGFPFANVAHGNNSVIADRVALKLADYVVTESGFGADCGAEKLFDIVCRQSRLKVDCAVVTLSIRALKMHGGAYEFRPGQKYDKAGAEKVNMPALEKGCGNLRIHIENMREFGLPVVVTINLFSADQDEEIDFVRKYALDNGAAFAVPLEAWARGGAGCTEAAEAVVKACEMPNNFHQLYPDNIPIKEKIETIATKIYRAGGVDYSPLADRQIRMYEDIGLRRLCINMAKTQLSITHDPLIKGVPPPGYRITVRDVRASAGAGFLYPILGDMMTMPGLPTRPAFQDVDIDRDGKTIGLF